MRGDNIDDSLRAEKNPYRASKYITQPSNLMVTFFYIGLQQLVEIVEGYRQSTYNEDMVALENLGGKYNIHFSTDCLIFSYFRCQGSLR